MVSVLGGFQRKPLEEFWIKPAAYVDVPLLQDPPEYT